MIPEPGSGSFVPPAIVFSSSSFANRFGLPMVTAGRTRSRNVVSLAVAETFPVSIEQQYVVVEIGR